MARALIVFAQVMQGVWRARRDSNFPSPRAPGPRRAAGRRRRWLAEASQISGLREVRAASEQVHEWHRTLVYLRRAASSSHRVSLVEARPDASWVDIRVQANDVVDGWILTPAWRSRCRSKAIRFHQDWHNQPPSAAPPSRYGYRARLGPHYDHLSHGGQVAIRSRDGQGTVVSIRLPVPGRAGTAPAVADLRQRRDSHGKVPV